MKITAKTTKQELKDILNANSKAVKAQDKNLYDRIIYTGKKVKEDDSKVTKRDLADLVKEVFKVLGDKFITPAMAEQTTLTTIEPQAENSVKKLSKGVSKKQKSMEKAEEVPEEVGNSEQTAEDTQEVVETPEVTEEKVDKKSAKKSSKGKKAQPKKEEDGVTDLEALTNSKKAVQLAKAFPKTLEVGDVKYELAEDIETLDNLYDALNNDEEIVFAYYWTKRHLKQFPYFGGWLGQPKSFDHDLDLATAIYVSDEKKVSYQVSMYTEAVYTILPTDFEVEDGVRVAGGIEYQIYRAVNPQV